MTRPEKTAATSPRFPRLFGSALLTASLLAAAGCASAGGGGATTSTDPSIIAVTIGDGTVMELRRGGDVRLNQSVTLTPQQAFESLPGVYRDIGLTIDQRDPASLQVGVSRHRFSREVLDRRASDFFDCGTDPGLGRPTADQVPIDASIVTQVLQQGGATELRTTVQGTARRTGGNAGVATCQSTGLMENLIGRLVQERGGEG